MNNEDVKKITQAVREVVKEEVSNALEVALKPVHQKLDSHSGALIEIEATLKGYADSYKTNKSNIERVDERVSKLEENSGVIVPQELTIQR